MKRISKSFSRRLTVNILISCAILFLIALGTLAWFAHSVLADEAETSAQHLLHSTVKEVEGRFGKVEAAVATASWMAEEHLQDSTFLHHITQKLTEDANILGSSIAFDKYYFPRRYFFAPYSYKDENGEIQQKMLGSMQYDYLYMDWFQIPYLLGEPCWSEPYFDEGGARILMTTYSYPLKDENGKTYAIMTADVAIDWISDMLAEIKPYPHSTVSMISRSGSYVTLGENKILQGETVYSTALRTGNEKIVEIADAMTGGEDGSVHYMRKGKASFVVYGPLNNGWSMSITCPYSEVLARAAKMNLFLILIVFFGLALLSASCYYMINRLTKPLSEFSKSALRIAEGDFDTVLPDIKSEDEIKQLHDSFDYMERSLTNYIKDLKATTASKERMESELNIASKIQMAMLATDFPHTDRIGLHALLRPAKEVGGDLYDFFIKDNRLYFAIGDVSGKGIPASMFMAITHSMFRFIAGMGLPMDQVMYRMNNAICSGNTSGMFVTMFIACLDLETGKMEYCNAGHNPILVNNRFLDVKPNLAVGLFEDFPYQKQELVLERGSVMLLYTDGVTEAERADKVQFENERLMKWARHTALFPSAQSAAEDLFKTVKDFTEGNEPNDDITIMTIKFK